MSEDELTPEEENLILSFCEYVHQVEQKLSDVDSKKELVIEHCVNHLLEIDREVATKVMITTAVKPFCEAAQSLATAEMVEEDGMWN